MTLEELQGQAHDAGQRLHAMRDKFNQAMAREGRDRYNRGEEQALEDALREATGAKARLAAKQSDARMMAAIERKTGGMTSDMVAGIGRRTLGQQVVATDAMQWLFKNSHALPDGSWNSPSSELPALRMMATTLSEDSGSGGALITPHYLPGVLVTPTRPLTMADLIMPGETDSNLISFMKETTFTNAAAPVLEAGTKPESTLVFAAATAAVRKLAHWIPVTEELLEDQAQMASIIDSRLRIGVELVEDDQLLNGSGVAPNLLGFMTLPGLTTALARGADSNADAILKQIALIRTATNLAPDAIVMHPTNWQTIQLTKAADGTYISGLTPFSAPVGPTLWGLRVVLTTAITVNTALVGSFQAAAQLFRRGGLRVEASNSHANFFVENKVAIRAEERLALAVYREAAFGKVTGLN